MRQALGRGGRCALLALVPALFIAALLAIWPTVPAAVAADADGIAAVPQSEAITAVPPDDDAEKATSEVEDNEDDPDDAASTAHRAHPRRGAGALIRRFTDSALPVVPFRLSAFPARAPPPA